MVRFGVRAPKSTQSIRVEIRILFSVYVGQRFSCVRTFSRQYFHLFTKTNQISTGEISLSYWEKRHGELVDG